MEQNEYTKMDAIEKNHFWFDAKRKCLETVLKKYAPAGRLKILDVGCGTGAVMEFLKNLGYEAEGVDMSDDALNYCRAKGLQVKKGTAEKMDYPAESFDAVLALDVLEHLENDGAAVSEINRIIKRGGLFIATVPAHRFLWSYHDAALHHKRRYARQEFENLLQKHLRVELVSWIHACIFLPTLIVRGVKKIFRKNSGESDVKAVGPLVNALGRACYIPELAVFKIFHRLPFGISLIGVARKE